MIKADGSYTYTLNNALLAVNQLNDGQTLTETFNYTAKDGDGSAASSTLVITINGHHRCAAQGHDQRGGPGRRLSLQEGTASSGAQDFAGKAGVGSITLGSRSAGVALPSV